MYLNQFLTRLIEKNERSHVTELIGIVTAICNSLYKFE